MGHGGAWPETLSDQEAAAPVGLSWIFPLRRVRRPRDSVTAEGTPLLQLHAPLWPLRVEKVHPHKFRRTMATRAIEKGMPIEQVQKILGHEQIDTTLRYAMVNQNNVKLSHRKYIS